MRLVILNCPVSTAKFLFDKNRYYESGVGFSLLFLDALENFFTLLKKFILFSVKISIRFPKKWFQWTDRPLPCVCACTSGIFVYLNPLSTSFEKVGTGIFDHLLKNYPSKSQILGSMERKCFERLG